MPSLKVLRGPEAGKEYRLDQRRTVLGRHPDCQIVLDVGAVSRQHAQVIEAGGQFFLEDLHSRNGTFLNGQPIQGRRRLTDGDQVSICDLSFGFFDETAQGVSSTGTTLDGSSIAFLPREEENLSSSTIMSRLDLSADSSRILLEANPQAKLRAMLEITNSLSRSLALDDVLPKVLDSLFKIFLQADRGFIVLRMDKDGPLVPKAVKFRRPDQEDTIRISRTVIEKVLDDREAVLSADAASDDRFQMSQSIADFHIRSMMCAPLIDSEGNALGIIQIDTLDQRSRFTKDDLAMLASVASQAAIAIENAQLHDAAMRQQAVELDLRLAHRVQQGLLPGAAPRLEGYEFFDFYEPANQVGGDYYDYVDLPDGRVAVVLADVSGKGVSAALLMARLSSDVRYCLATHTSAAEAISQLNNTFIRSGWDDRFVTLVALVLDARTHSATVVNAGHMAPLLRHANRKVEQVGEEATGLPLGVAADYAYEATEIVLQPGDVLAVFTDGFSEAMNADGELYGLDRLRKRLSVKASDFGELGRSILSDVKEFAGGRAQTDDMCLVCVGRVEC